jgi:rRNA maturation RNase YbeY
LTTAESAGSTGSTFHATDVLAFDLSDGPDAPIEGEIYVSLEMAALQAREARVTFTNEVLRLVAHGFLHLLGFDDSTASQRSLMLATGERYLAAAERDP